MYFYSAPGTPGSYFVPLAPQGLQPQYVPGGSSNYNPISYFPSNIPSTLPSSTAPISTIGQQPSLQTLAPYYLQPVPSQTYFPNYTPPAQQPALYPIQSTYPTPIAQQLPVSSYYPSRPAQQPTFNPSGQLPTYYQTLKPIAQQPSFYQTYYQPMITQSTTPMISQQPIYPTITSQVPTYRPSYQAPQLPTASPLTYYRQPTIPYPQANQVSGYRPSYQSPQLSTVSPLTYYRQPTPASNINTPSR